MIHLLQRIRPSVIASESFQHQFFWKAVKISMQTASLPNAFCPKDYHETVKCLNSLQSNLKVKQLATSHKFLVPNHVDDTLHCLKLIGIGQKELEQLNPIHIAGTKGKGSSCAFIESLLRNHGYKTGFFSSPHLICVTERIKINGVPISEEKFVEYFGFVYSKLKSAMSASMPFYFKFLTVMSFHVFLKENVDVAIIETGLGGLTDCTNIIRKPVVVGLTTIDYDHMEILGDTLQKIASQKAGIMKPSVPTATMPQEPDVTDIFTSQASIINCKLYRSEYINLSNVKLGIPGEIQYYNAQLAVLICRLWLQYIEDKHEGNLYMELSEKEKLGLSTCCWPGRFQTIIRNDITYCLDGAHTEKSMKHCY